MFWPQKLVQVSAFILLVTGIGLWFSLPDPLFDRPLAWEILDREGQLIGGQVAEDGQWRFEGPEHLPAKYRVCLLQFEDHRYTWHPGFDAFAMLRAFFQNVRAHRIVSGGSTISMQVIRLQRAGQPRNFWEKMIEMLLAWRLELSCSKEEILGLYAQQAPYGGNVVGLEAAAWRYYGRDPNRLSWAESAALAVLPNQPSAVRPGKGEATLAAKRNRLLLRLQQSGIIDSLEYSLATIEPVPNAPLPLPQEAHHFIQWEIQRHPGKHRFKSTLDPRLQHRVLDVVNRYQSNLTGKEIHNAAVLITSVDENEVLAYVGNLPGAGQRYDGWVDCIQAPRSTGSILKPFLTTAAFTRGLVHPNSLLPDVPLLINGYQPENFNLSYEGAVSTEEALRKSLNIPMVNLLRKFGPAPFLAELHKAGFTTFPQPADHYGLSLILGGGETTLWELNTVYSSMARTLLHYTQYDSQYLPGDWRESASLMTESTLQGKPKWYAKPGIWPAGAIWLSFEAMTALTRPDEEGHWQEFPSQQRVAWKTGTSFGFRDAWAVGITPQYVISVWAGNADGEGRPGCTGIQAAAPLMFQVLGQLPGSSWFTTPYDDLSELVVCRESGYLAGKDCPRDTVWGLPAMERMPPCSFHHRIWINPDNGLQVDRGCFDGPSKAENWFILPPLQAYYYRHSHPWYLDVPRWQDGCRAGEDPMALIYPHTSSRDIYLPTNGRGAIQPLIMKATHINPSATIYWHLDGKYLQSTQGIHSLSLSSEPGPHRLVLVDEDGNQLERAFVFH